MCPKRIRAMAPKQNQYISADKRRTNEILNVNHIGRTNLITSLLKDTTAVLGNVEHEPGLPLEDDEITRLKLWHKGIIPYYIDTVSYSDKILRDRIRLFLNTVNSLTMLRFVELPSPPEDEQTRYVFFVNRRAQLACFDHSTLEFTNHGVQQVHLGYDCLSSDGELAKAVLSIAGVPPQHNAPNRDQYIKINEENIMPDKKHLFEKVSLEDWVFDCESYDYQSASHYSNHQYSVNGRATIEVQPERALAGSNLGVNNKFTKTDIMKLRMLYNHIVKKEDKQLPACRKLFRKGANFREDVSVEFVPVPLKRPPRCQLDQDSWNQDPGISAHDDEEEQEEINKE
ncbi:hypothetical protein PYW07_000849 [Mythimna separata]|uniref:Metalloendopeptidase n=1 Tax=Mythimna separata TaxID=271217 RepID=A0AAD7YSB3_MYTSE|nr:hypothetical protein PYW07_000849 [Mythimna separata]